MRFGEAGPGDFGIGEHYRWNGVRLEGNLVAGDGFDCRAAFMHGLMGEHRLSGNVSDGVDRGIGGLALLVDFDKALRIHFDLGFVETHNFRVRPTSDRHQHAVEHLFFLFHIRTVEDHANAVLLFF